MLKNTMLNVYEQHPYKLQLECYGIKQYDIAKTIGINRSTLSQMLAGIEPMKEIVEDEIGDILEHVKKTRKIRTIKRH